MICVPVPEIEELKDDPRRVQYDRTELMWDTDRLDPRHGVQ